jgi:hypothetical protein
MFRFVFITISAVGILLWCSCGSNHTRKGAKTENQWGTATNQLSITLSDDGVTDIGVADSGVWHNLVVRIENHSDRILYLPVLKEVSGYVRQRNAKAICYRVESFGRGWEDTWRGLEELGYIGKSGAELCGCPAGAVIEFHAPVPVDVALTRDKSIRIMLRAYVDPQEPGREFYSNEIRLPK